MSGGNHRTDGVSTFPFTIFGGLWGEKTLDIALGAPSRGDTVVGNDVWIGYQALIMPGVHIGNGAIIASGSVVVSDVPAYGVVGGNPAKVLKKRYSDPEIELLERIAWWDWPVEKVTEHVRLIMAGTPAELAEVA
ncbi:CatB-related O-acetyltransferase [Lentzea sp. PSKA42]|uniref:CatB-related O-acetyltransferase n=2 Tax=Lentzea indica TaxID=2604800 RepID=A0ABX1FH95_9PSEU|nr:CatB-related O-acetyltransferase [Lentzea indica]